MSASPDLPQAQTEPGDAELVARCRAGDGSAWAQLVRRYQRLIYTVVMRAGLAEDQAAEVFQACFTRLHEQLPRLREPERLRAWLVTTAKREALLQRERLGRLRGLDDGEQPLSDTLVDPDPLPEQQLDRLQQLDGLGRALRRLDARSQRWVELLFLQDEPLPYAEIAAQMGSTVGSIGPTRARLLAKLRALMSETG